MPKYVVLTSSAKMPNSCWGRYGNVAIIETDGKTMPKQINSRHKAVISIPWYRGRLHIGGPKSAYARAVDEAIALCAKWNMEGR